MRYSKIRKYDVTNGPGVRVTLFVSGCTHNCEGCFNYELQDFNHGEIWTSEVEETFINYVKDTVVVGVNLLGGEPLQQTMDDSLTKLLKRIKEETQKSIWLWTGDIFEEAINNKKKMEIIKYVDILVDGKFEKDKKNIKLKYRGSSNQRVIDVQKSIKNRKTIEIL